MIKQHRRMMFQAVDDILIPFLHRNGFTQFSCELYSKNCKIGNRLSPWGRFRKSTSKFIWQVEIIVNPNNRLPKIHIRSCLFYNNIEYDTENGYQFISNDGHDSIFICGGMEFYSMIDHPVFYKNYGPKFIFWRMYNENSYRKIVNRIADRFQYLERSIFSGKSSMYILKGITVTVH